MDNENNDLISDLTDDNVDSMGDALFEGWDDDSIPEDEETDNQEVEETEEAVETEDESESTDQTEEEAEEETEDDNNPKTGEKSGEKADKTSQPKSYTFTHLDDEPITLTPEEMVPYVNKGLDYDRIRQERDAMKANYSTYEMYAEFLDRIKGSFGSIEELMDDTDAALLVRNEAENGRTMTKEDALKKVKANREETYKSKVPPKNSENTEKVDNQRETEARSFVETFKKVFPEEAVPKWNDLPKEVQTEFEQTGKLTAPYLAWRLSQKEREIKTIKNNQKNKERSTGSRKTIGKGKHTIDPMLVGFDDD